MGAGLGVAPALLLRRVRGVAAVQLAAAVRVRAGVPPPMRIHYGVAPEWPHVRHVIFQIMSGAPRNRWHERASYLFHR